MLQTRDGCIVEILDASDDHLDVLISFALDARFATVLQCEPDAVVFSARSRLARLGINVRPASRPRLEPGKGCALMQATIRPWVFADTVWPICREFMLTELAVGRLLFAPEDCRLGAAEVYDGYRRNRFKLPAGFSITNNGCVVIPPHTLVYDFARPLTRHEIWSVLTSAEGRMLLNGLQVPRQVDNLVLHPGEGLITSCTAFLYSHFALIDSEPSVMGSHLEAVALDPVQTASTRTFLELYNHTDGVVVNPSVYARLFHADAGEDRARVVPPSPRQQDNRSLYRAEDHARLKQLFEFPDGANTYDERYAAISSDPLPDQPLQWVAPETAGDAAGSPLAVRYNSPILAHATALLEQRDGVVFMRYFPNLFEHADLLPRMRAGSVRALVFQHASFQHGFYLSSRDHARLTDYADLGVDVYWVNGELDHVARFVTRGARGYWCELERLDQFASALVVAVYGSSRPLGDLETERLRTLLKDLQSFFGSRLAVITGGGPGAMRAASAIGRELDMLVGASYLEIEDQRHNQFASFYQVFQESSRHIRQRWFDIASFNVFLVGGVGTLEEIGLTLTDMKLGLAEQTPMVFIGSSGHGRFWEPLREQLVRMVREGRAPARLLENSLVTDDPDEVVPFYRRVLRIG
jgi:predicted Rossmann-fold nucleotide-binding protein